MTETTWEDVLIALDQGDAKKANEVSSEIVRNIAFEMEYILLNQIPLEVDQMLPGTSPEEASRNRLHLHLEAVKGRALHLEKGNPQVVEKVNAILRKHGLDDWIDEDTEEST